MAAEIFLFQSCLLSFGGREVLYWVRRWPEFDYSEVRAIETPGPVRQCNVTDAKSISFVLGPFLASGKYLKQVVEPFFFIMDVSRIAEPNVQLKFFSPNDCVIYALLDAAAEDHLNINKCSQDVGIWCVKRSMKIHYTKSTCTRMNKRNTNNAFPYCIGNHLLMNAR